MTGEPRGLKAGTALSPTELPAIPFPPAVGPPAPEDRFEAPVPDPGLI